MPGKFHLYPFKQGEKLQLKKQHPCGGDKWIIERAGADIAIRCLTCGHLLVIARSKIEKSVRAVIPAEES